MKAREEETPAVLSLPTREKSHPARLALSSAKTKSNDKGDRRNELCNHIFKVRSENRRGLEEHLLHHRPGDGNIGGNLALKITKTGNKKVR
jgi:hypothetical protein